MSEAEARCVGAGMRGYLHAYLAVYGPVLALAPALVETQALHTDPALTYGCAAALAVVVSAWVQRYGRIWP